MVLRVAGCFIEHNGKFIILHRRPEKPQGNTWGLPAGRVEKGESDEEAVLREIQEETGYVGTKDELEFLGEFKREIPEQTLIFPTFRIKLGKPIDVKHSPDEHLGFMWVTPKECYKMSNLVHGFHDLLKIVGYVK